MKGIIDTVEIECDSVESIRLKRTAPGSMMVTMRYVHNDFIADIDAEQIVYGQEVDKILEAIGIEEVAAWLTRQETIK